MFEIRQSAAGEVIMAGRLDATQCDAALEFLNGLADLKAIDLGAVEYIGSAGLRVILLTLKRRKAAGGDLRLIHVPRPIFDVFHYAGFDQILDIQASG